MCVGILSRVFTQSRKDAKVDQNIFPLTTIKKAAHDRAAGFDSD